MVDCMRTSPAFDDNKRSEWLCVCEYTINSGECRNAASVRTKETNACVTFDREQFSTLLEWSCSLDENLVNI